MSKRLIGLLLSGSPESGVPLPTVRCATLGFDMERFQRSNTSSPLMF